MNDIDHTNLKAREYMEICADVAGRIRGGADDLRQNENCGSVRNRWQLARRPRSHVRFTPTSVSWLNMVERFFAEITDKKIKRGTDRSVHVLRQAIIGYIEQRNQDPKPFKWARTADQILASVKR